MTTPESAGAIPEAGQPAPPSPQTPPVPSPDASGKPPRNTVGLISLIVSIVGFIFAVIPGAIIIGWILLPIGFILAIVSFFQKGKGKGLGIAGLIVSIVGTIVGAVVFAAVVIGAVGDALDSGGATSVEEPVDTDTDESTEAEPTPEAVGPDGTRENPYPLGSTVSSDEWEVLINSVTFNANDAVAAENQFNEPPAEGNEYILVNATLTYIGTDSEGGEGIWTSVDYVTPAGVTIGWSDNFVVAPDAIDLMTTLYSGASVSGNYVFEVPTDGAQAGVIAVAPGLFAETVFITVQ